MNVACLRTRGCGAHELDALREAGTYKRFNTLCSPQGPLVEMEGRGEVLVLSSNNYLGLADRPEVIEAGIEGLRKYGAGTASVRFICGTFEPHLELERELADLVGTEASLTYVSCWNANEAAIPSLTDENTVILSDELNHASIIDAVRLAKPARKAVYKHSDMDSLRAQLASLETGQRALVITDGVFSMEGDLAKLPEIVELVREHDATLVVDDSHGTGVVGDTGRGVAEHYGLLGEVDVITSTLGKALGGAAGGFVAASEEVCDILAQRSRPQLFSNALPPTVACSALEAVRVVRREPELVAKLHRQTEEFRERLRASASSRSTARRRSCRSSSARPRSRSEFRERLLERACSSPGSASRSCRRGLRACGFRCRRRSRRSTWSGR